MNAPRPRVLSYGGGVDSFAMLLLAIEQGSPPDVCVFCDVSNGNMLMSGTDPGEWPGTYRHIRETVIPVCDKAGIGFVWLTTEQYPVRDAQSLYAWLHARKQIPVAGPNRICTTVAKVERFERWMNDQYPGQDVEVWVGFEAGEESRAENDPNAGTKKKVKPGYARRHNRFPLIEMRFCRCRCELHVRAAGYPVPRKSACTYCPYASKGDWQILARDLPEDFEKAAELESQKPPTSNGKKLSIMGYRTIKNDAGEPIAYKAPPLEEFIKGVYRPKKQPCKVCGRAQRASKATGCDYLPEMT